ncbi:unnamed protein product [Peronospora effusa]|uniref:Uncharacterized protein n=1 Tax=Peronospora effusa TaxID=542832 RepID=A0A3M6VTC1_9STRA|nr:hypothetical protein DD238_000878 [Peronospora effusa]RQM18502.1 hypothetical protein DD237_001775 [Peronospora effusa]CAI5719349.1 unnamed protein product [Peronospora effusa]
MAITADVKNQLFKPSYYGTGELIRLPSEAPSIPFDSLDKEKMLPTNTNGRAWTAEEHNRFLGGLELFPSGPWKEIAAHVGSRTTRQTMTHAQKYREKIARRKRGLRSSVKNTCSLKRRRNHKHQNHSHKTMKDTASPCSVAVPSLSTRKGVDFDQCLVPGPTQYQFCGIDSVPEMEISNFAATLGDFDPLPMSKEEIDFILEAATLQTPTSQTHSLDSCSDDIFFLE